MRTDIDLSKIRPMIDSTDGFCGGGDPVRLAKVIEIATENNYNKEKNALIVYDSTFNSKTNLMKVGHQFDCYSLVDFNRMIMYTFTCKTKPKTETFCNTFNIARLDDSRWVVEFFDPRVNYHQWCEFDGCYQPNMVTMEAAYTIFKSKNCNK
jgi:hypothetical protein